MHRPGMSVHVGISLCDVHARAFDATSPHLFEFLWCSYTPDAYQNVKTALYNGPFYLDTIARQHARRRDFLKRARTEPKDKVAAGLSAHEAIKAVADSERQYGVGFPACVGPEAKGIEMSNETLSRRGFVGTMGAFVLAMGAGLVGCESRGRSAASSTISDSNGRPGSKTLIVLWSWSGKTAQMAERISELSGAEIYRIEAADPYPGIDNYEECTDRAKREQDDGVYPKIANPIANWDDYGTIFLGYPIWWYQLPMIVQGFVRDHDWKGRTVVPFNSHLGSGDGGTYAYLREMTGTTVLDGIAISGDDIPASLERIDGWYAGLGL